MESNIPFGVRLTRAINLVSIVLNFIIAILLVCIAVPNFIKAALKAGKTANPIVVSIFGLGMLVIFLIPAAFLIKLNKALELLKEKARIWQIVISFLFLLVFPLGTILYGVVLYYMFFDKNTKEAFGIETTSKLV